MPSALHRFFAPTLDPGDEAVTLPKDEGEHLTRVLRVAVGDTVSVFDGRGREFLARVLSADRRDVRLQPIARVEPPPESRVKFLLAQAVLKGDKMDEVVRDAVMLGVAAIQPLVTKRSETTVAALLRGNRVDRWQRVALASTKQSRRAVLAEVRMPLTLETYLDEPLEDLRLLLTEPQAGSAAEPLGVLRSVPVPRDVSLVVGPEGGWAESEWRLSVEKGARPITLGARTLRADAVPVAAISVLQFLWESD
jgi:16S rRNA (uracil1498-N3)-methyltransferase